ncbi:MAG: translation elongation factor 4 [Proteobacteria bacterium]|nr:translation elongation factor 4 [Pseudomonadota bacterium]
MLSSTSHIRNFSIIAHIDHGKSTLADRLIEHTQSLAKREMEAQVLDNMDLEKERGITIKAQTASMSYQAASGEFYQLNLIDTPGHADFSYEVSRSLAACEGALVIVDGSQGVEAQTLSHVHLAMQEKLTLIPVINKVDLPHAEPELVGQDIEDLLTLPKEDIVLTSAKSGQGITELLEAIVKRIPPPTDASREAFRALIFDSWFDSYLGAVSLVRVMAGSLRKREKMLMMSSGKKFDVVQIAKLTPRVVVVPTLNCGEVGFISGSIKHVQDTQVGDTITSAEKPATEALEGFIVIKPVVFGGIFPMEASDYPALKDSLEKLQLNDSSLTIEPENSGALGLGYRVGFLGLLHMDIIQERLQREYNLSLIFTAPSVVYHVVKKDGTQLKVENPAKLPDTNNIEEINEPYVLLTIHSPSDYIGAIMKLVQSRRGIQQNMEYLASRGKTRVQLTYSLPMMEMIYDFHDHLKSISSGYASMEYEHAGYKPGDLIKLNILVNGETVDALSCITHRDAAVSRGRYICQKLKENLARHMFQIAIQAAIGGKIIARETLSAFRKDVTAKCYGGDITRKRKLLEKQKEGKKKMKAIGRVQIPQKAFLSILTGGKP